jgi:hypothetical protein
VVNVMSDFDSILNTEEEWTAPSEKEFDDKEVLNWWLMDKACRVSIIPRPPSYLFTIVTPCVGIAVCVTVMVCTPTDARSRLFARI